MKIAILYVMVTSYSRILLNVSDRELVETLKNRLPSEKFDITCAYINMGESSSNQSMQIFNLVIDESPDILIFEIGLNGQTPDVIISAIKKVRPNIKIIALSRSPSTKDADVIEQGVFYYMGEPDSEELVQVIQAATNALERSRRKEVCYEDRKRY